MASLQGHLASQAEITPALPADGRSRHHQPESSGIESRLSADEDVASKHEDDSKDADDVAGATDVENKEFTMTDQTLRLPMLRVIIVMAAASSCVLLSFLDQTIVSSALPTISSYFNSGKQSSWVATAYLVSSTAASPLYGRFSDIFGRKIVLLGAVSMFTIFSMACALAQTMLQLILFRAFQGIFGGGLLTMVFIIMSDIVSLKDRGKYQGIIEGAIAIANGIGPVLGAVFAEKASWRWCFWINLPLSGLALVLLVVFLPSKKTEGDMLAKFKAVDYVGSFASLAATVLMLVGLTWGGIEYPWKSVQVLAPICIAAIVAIAFLVWEAKVAKHPIIPMKVFKNVTSAGALAVTFLLGSVYYILLFYVPNFLQVVRGYSAVKSSVLILPFVLLATFTVEATGLIISYCGRYREFIIAGFSIWAVGLGLLTTFTSDVSDGKVIGFLTLCGLGTGLTVQSTLIAMMASCEHRSDVAVAVSVRNYMRLLGGSIFVSVAATVVNNELRNRLDGVIDPSILQIVLEDPTAVQHSLKGSLNPDTHRLIIEAYVRSFKSLFYLATGLMLGAVAIAALFIRHYTLTKAEDKQLKEEGKKYLEEQKRKKQKKKTDEKVAEEA